MYLEKKKYLEYLKTEVKSANERVLYLNSMVSKLQSELEHRDLSELSTQDLIELIMSVQHMLKEEGNQKFTYFFNMLQD